LKTKNNKIYIEPNHIDKEELILNEIKEIRDALFNGNNGTAVELVKEYVKTYNKDEFNQ
jgi:hypothetical protein